MFHTITKFNRKYIFKKLVDTFANLNLTNEID
jgi:hypothetical protein